MATTTAPTTHRDVVEQFLRENGHPRAEVWRVIRDDSVSATATQWTEQSIFGYVVQAGGIIPWETMARWAAEKAWDMWDLMAPHERGLYVAWVLEPESLPDPE